MTEINPCRRVMFAFFACYVVAYWGVLGFGVGFNPELPPAYGTMVGVGFLVGFVITMAGMWWPYTILLMLASFVLGHTAAILL